MADVLIVEDNEDLRELFVEVLASDGFSSRAAASGREAIEQLRQNLPRLILLDLYLGEGDVDVMSTIRTDPRLSSIPVVLLSGAQDLEQRTRQVGATDYLRKPTSPEDLLRIAQRHCRR